MENSAKNVEIIDRFIENEHKSRIWTTINITIFCLLGLVVFWLAFEWNKSNAKFQLQNVELKRTKDSLKDALTKLDMNVQSLTTDSVSASTRAGNYDSLKQAFDTVLQLFKSAQLQHTDMSIGDLSQTAFKKDVNISENIRKVIYNPSVLTAQSNAITIYMHYMPGYEEVSEDVTSDLKTHSYIIPGQQKITNVSFDPVVKYFHDEDKDLAEQVVTLINRENSYLSENPARVQKLDLKSPPRQLEIWIGKYQQKNLQQILQQQPILQQKPVIRVSAKKLGA